MTGPVHEVLASGRSERPIVRLDDLAGGLAALRSAGIEAVVEAHAIRVSLPQAEADLVSRALADRGLYLTELRPDELALETVFLELTGRAAVEGSR